MGINWRILCLGLLLSMAVNAQQNVEYKIKHWVKDSDTLQYRILFPRHFEVDRMYPLVLFLHGAGERGSDNEKQLTHGSWLFTDEVNNQAFPAIVLFPQCPEDSYWASVDIDRSSYPIGLDFHYENGPTKALEGVIDLMEDFMDRPYIDKNKVYVIGLSMGGMGTYEILYRKPDMFAAAIAICGGGDPSVANEYAGKVPVWAFHGSRDNVVKPIQSLNMVSALVNAGAEPRFTLYDKANHNSWDPAFHEPDFLLWLFSHSNTH